MNHTLILDISSDEEVGFDDSTSADNFDWISNLLEDVPSKDDALNFIMDVPNNGVDDDSDDVVVVGEVFAKPKKAKFSVPRCQDQGFADDDCVLLNCHPDKPAPAKEVGDDQGSDVGSDVDSDELVIVGEKGQVACRDYPHSRHLCAKFPYASTPHESHCDLCHCYVCDSLAPCAYWGSGDSGLDHCCATDKSEYWQLERKKMRETKNPSVPGAKPAADSLSRPSQLQQTSGRPTPVLRPASTSGISSSFGLPNIISHSKSQRPNIAMHRSRFQPHQIGGRTSTLRACNIATRSNRTPNLVSSRSHFKRSGFPGRASVVSRSAYIPSYDSVPYWQQMLNHPVVGKASEINSISLTESSPHLDVNISSTQPFVSSISTGTLPSHMESFNNNSVAQAPTSHFQGYGQSTVGTTGNPWVYSSGSQTQHISWPDCDTSNAVNSVTLSSQQAPAVIQNVSGPNFPGSPAGGLSSIAPRIHQPSEAIQKLACLIDPYNNASNSMNSTAQGFQLSAENLQVEGAVAANGFLPSFGNNPETSGSMSSSPLDFDLDGWLPENDPILGAQDVSNLFNMSNQPSVPGSIDPGMLTFDFETTWKSLTQ